MSVASLVLGIVSIVFAVIPVVGNLFFVTALIGLILGIVAIVRKSNGKKGNAVAGFILCLISIVFIFFYNYIVINFVSNYGQEILNKIKTEYKEHITDDNFKENIKIHEIIING